MSRTPLKFGRYDFASFAAFTMYSICSLAIPLMIVAMGKSLNFKIDEGGMASGGLLHVIRSIFMVISLLSCGLIAAKIGKRLTMGFSVLCFGIGISCCAFAEEYWMLLPCLIIAGLGEGICEGIATPFIQDMHKDYPERYVNIGHSFWSVGIACAVLIVGGLVSLGTNWRIVMSAIGILTILSSLGFLWKENPNNKYPENREKTDLAVLIQQTKIIFREKDFYLCCLAMFFGAGAEFGLTFWAAAYIELNFKTSAFIAGLGTGAIALGMFVGRTFFGYIAKPKNLRWIIAIAALSTIPVTLFLANLKIGMMPSWALFTILFVLLFLSGIGVAPYWPTTQVYGVAKLPHCDSTLLYIYYSAIGVPGCGFFSYLMGVVGDKYGLTGAILVVPACLVLFLLIIYCECWLSKPSANTTVYVK